MAIYIYIFIYIYIYININIYTSIYTSKDLHLLDCQAFTAGVFLMTVFSILTPCWFVG